MLGYDSKDSRLQVTMSLSCSVSAIFDGRILIDSIHCILSHQLLYSYLIGVRDKASSCTIHHIMSFIGSATS